MSTTLSPRSHSQLPDLLGGDEDERCKQDGQPLVPVQRPLAEQATERLEVDHGQQQRGFAAT